MIGCACVAIFVLLEVATSDEIGGDEDEERDDLEDGHLVPNVPDILGHCGLAQATTRTKACRGPGLPPSLAIGLYGQCRVVPQSHTAIGIASPRCLAT